MKLRGFLVVLVCLLGTSFANDDDPEHPIASPPVGKIQGSIIKSRLGKPIYSFRGIRYAEPPIGQQRFQVPIPIAPWNDVFNGTEEGPSCPSIGGAFKISEDCLRLNVYTRQLLSTSVKGSMKKKPVLVFIHPGGFYAFSGQSRTFGPQYLMDKDIVLVSINYRLASLGFLSTGDSLAPGNLGYKDQVIALRWIQTNIAAFGGDPNSVTISGYSAGSISVILHMLSPMSKDLFHRAIAMSASPLGFTPTPRHQKHLAIKQAELLGCPTDTTGAMLVCLNSKPVENFTNTILNFFEWHYDPIGIWRAVVEPEVHGVERFLPDEPLNLIRQGKFHKVPLIIGVTKDEFGSVSLAYENEAKKGNFSLFDDVNENWETLAPISFMYERETPRSREISKELRRFYFNDQPVQPSNLEGIAKLYADIIIIPVHWAVKYISENSDQPVYFYEFSYQGRYSFTMRNNTTPYGVVHHDDLQYLFHISTIFPYYEGDGPEVSMVEMMTAMWTNFAKTSEPIPKNNDRFKNVTWERYSSAKDNFLNIDLSPTMQSNFYPDRVQFWDRLLPVRPLPGSIKH